MKFEEVDLDKCLDYVRKGKCDNQHIDMYKDILNLYAKGSKLSARQKNVLKRFYIIEVLDIDIFEDEVVCNLTMTEIRERLK